MHEPMGVILVQTITPPIHNFKMCFINSEIHTCLPPPVLPLTPPRSTPEPQISSNFKFSHSFFFFFLKKINFGVQFVCLYTLGCEVTHWRMINLSGPHPWKKTSSPFPYQLSTVSSSSAGVGAHEPFCQAGVWIDFILCRSYAWRSRVLCPYRTSLRPSQISGYYNFSVSSSMVIPESQEMWDLIAL
jgi:hypothetical protein